MLAFAFGWTKKPKLVNTLRKNYPWLMIDFNVDSIEWSLRDLLFLDFDIHAVKQCQGFWKGELRFQDLIV